MLARVQAKGETVLGNATLSRQDQLCELLCLLHSAADEVATLERACEQERTEEEVTARLEGMLHDRRDTFWWRLCKVERLAHKELNRLPSELDNSHAVAVFLASVALLSCCAGVLQR